MNIEEQIALRQKEKAFGLPSGVLSQTGSTPQTMDRDAQNLAAISGIGANEVNKELSPDSIQIDDPSPKQEITLEDIDAELERRQSSEGVSLEDIDRELAKRESSKPQDKTVQNIARDLAIGAQSGLEGIASAVSPLYDAASAPLVAMGAKIPTLEQQIKGSSYYVQPEGREQLDRDIIKGATTALPYIMTGGALGSQGATGSLMSNAGKVLGSNPLQQIAGMAGAEAGGGDAKRQGYGALGQIASMIAGGAAGVGAGATAEKLIPEAKSALVKIGELFGKKSITGKSDSAVSALEKYSKELLPSQSDISTVTGKQININEPLSKYGAVGDKTVQIPEKFTSVQQLHDKSQELRQSMSAQGVKTKPETTNKLFDVIESTIPTNEVAQATKSSNPIYKFVDDLKALKDKPLSYDSIDQIDQKFNDAIWSNTDAFGHMNPSAHQLKTAQVNFRNVIKDLPDSAFVGNTDKGVRDMLKKSNELWSRTRITQDLERLQYRASLSENPASVIRNGAKSMLSSKKTAGYTDGEIKLLEKAAKSGSVDEIMRTFGGRLFPMMMGAAGFGSGGALSGILTAAGSSIGSKAARSVAENTAKGRINDVILNVANRPFK